MPRFDHQPANINRAAEAAGILWLMAALWYVALEAVAAAGFPGYSYANNFISDLGVTGADMLGRPLQSHLQAAITAAFVGQGVLFAGAALLLRAASPRALWGTIFLILACLHAAGFILVAVVPSTDIGLAVVQTFHSLGAVGVIVVGNLAILALAAWQRTFLSPAVRLVIALVAGAGLLSLWMLIRQSAGAPFLFANGTWERGSVYSVILAEAIAGVTIIARRSTSVI